MILLPSEGEIACDACNYAEPVDLTTFAGEPETVGLESVPEGWTSTGPDTHYCPDCKDFAEQEGAAE